MAICTVNAQTSNQDVLDVNEAAALLRVKPEIVLSWAETNRIPARRLGVEWRFWRAALLEWLKGDTAGAATGQVKPPACVNCPDPLQRTLPAVAGKGVGTSPQALTEKGLGISPAALATQVAGLSPPGVAAAAAIGPAPSVPGSADPAPKPSQGSSVLGARPATPSSEDIALRDQRVLLSRGGATFEFGGTYGQSSQILLPVVRNEQQIFGATATLRYGIENDLQLTVRAPVIWRLGTTYSAAAVSGSSSARITPAPATFAADSTVSLLGVAMRENVHKPTIIWSLDQIVPVGAGDRGVGAGLVFSKSYDPAVLFAGINYMYGLRINPSDPRWTLARQNFGFQVGYTYAINDNLALSTGFFGTYRNTRPPDASSIPPQRESYTLQLGGTWLLAPGLFVEPGVGLNLGSDNPGLILSLSFSRPLRWRSKF